MKKAVAKTVRSKSLKSQVETLGQEVYELSKRASKLKLSKASEMRWDATKLVLAEFKEKTLLRIQKAQRMKLPVFDVFFQTEIQVDGFSDWRDREFKTVKKRVRVRARDIEHAKKVAVKLDEVYSRRGWNGWPVDSYWKKEDIKRVKKVK